MPYIPGVDRFAKKEIHLRIIIMNIFKFVLDFLDVESVVFEGVALEGRFVVLLPGRVAIRTRM